jgi:hypothetical protein
MPIQSGDVKLLKSAVMADVPEGGGAPTGAVIADGVSNSIFPDISELDRAGGRVSLRKTFAAIHTDDRDTYFGANVIVAEPPSDPRVSVTLFSNESTFDKRAEAQARVEAYLNKGPEWSGYLYENHISGQRVIQIFQRVSDVLPAVGQTLVLIQDEGTATEKMQYIRATSVSAVERTFTYNTDQDYQAMIVTIDLSDALRYDFIGSPASRSFTRATNGTRIRDTVVADAGSYAGVVALTDATAIGDFTVQTESIFTQLVPSAQTEAPVADVRANGLSVALVATGDAVTRNLTMAFSTTQAMYVGGPIYPGSLSVSRAGITVADSGGILVSAGAQVGTVDYENGVLTLSSNVFGSGGGTHTVTFKPAAVPELVSEQSAYLISAENRSQSYALSIGNRPVPRSTTVSFLAQGRWYVLRDEGNGVLRGIDAAYGAGTVNYTTGSVLVTLGALPDVGGAIVITSYSEITTDKRSNTDLLNAGKVYIPINTDGNISEENGAKPIIPSQLIVSWVVGGVTKTATDNGLGGLTGDGTGTVDYTGGVVRLSPNQLPDVGSTILIDTSRGSVTTYENKPISGGNLGANVVPGTVRLKIPGHVNYTWGTYYVQAGSKQSYNVFEIYDKDADGNLYLSDYGNNGVFYQCGTINYVTGDYTITNPTGVLATDSSDSAPVLSFYGAA